MQSQETQDLIHLDDKTGTFPRWSRRQVAGPMTDQPPSSQPGLSLWVWWAWLCQAGLWIRTTLRCFWDPRSLLDRTPL